MAAFAVSGFQAPVLDRTLHTFNRQPRGFMPDYQSINYQK